MFKGGEQGGGGAYPSYGGCFLLDALMHLFFADPPFSKFEIGSTYLSGHKLPILKLIFIQITEWPGCVSH